ncbi:MFS transporter [Brevibacterium ihuae]|uniref:MFS transporter n=1 Tax=Brevibacterium ihuae TaxID=1631743 RepID=UPI000C7867F5|nr:MFS transporter [Brevibacterium ihuae]
MLITLGRMVGWGILPLGVIAKLPFAMSVVAVMTAVSSTRESFTLAGATAALVGVGTAISGPLLGAGADRWGQRVVLLVAASAHGLALFGLALALRAAAPTALVLGAGLLIGLTAPQASSMVRTRWLHAIRARLSGAEARKATSAVLSYESMTDELVFVFGPVLTGFVAVLLGVVVPLEFAAVLTLVGVTAFALHRSSRFTRGHARDSRHAIGTAEDAAVRRLAPVAELRRPAVLLPVAGMVAIGLFFGSSLTSLTGFMEELGQGDATGIYYGIMGVSSAACALGVVLLPERFTFSARWLVFAALAVAGGILYVLAGGIGAIVPALLVMGAGIGPSLVTLYSIASEVAPLGRTTTVMAMMSTGVVVGQSASAALTGVVVDVTGYRQGFGVACAALVLLLCLGAVQMAALRRAGSIPAER